MRVGRAGGGAVVVARGPVPHGVLTPSLLLECLGRGGDPAAVLVGDCCDSTYQVLRLGSSATAVLDAVAAAPPDATFLVRGGDGFAGVLDKCAFLDRVVKRLHLRVEDVPGAVREGRVAILPPAATVYEALRRLRDGAEMTVVVEDGRPTGVLTSGDVSRLVRDGCNLWRTPAGQVMSLPAVTVEVGTLAHDALDLLAANAIGSLVVTDRAGRARGLLTVEDLARAVGDRQMDHLKAAVRDQEARLERSLRTLSARSLYFDTVLSSTLKAGVIGTDRNLRIIHANSAARNFFGDDGSPRPGQDLRTLPYFRTLDPGVLRAALRRALDGEEHVFTFAPADGDGTDGRDAELGAAAHGEDGGPSAATQCRIAAVRAKDRPIGFVITFQDLGEQRAAEDVIRRLAYYDSLTDLPNRVLFFERLATELRHARRRGEVLAVMLLDLNDFKNVNDRHGHLFGDKFLRAAGLRLHDALRDSDTVARLGGDEFTFILPDIAARTNAALIARKLLDELKRPFDIDGVRVESGGSIGIALFPEDGADPESLLGEADADMYRHKRRAKPAPDGTKPHAGQRLSTSDPTI